MFTSSIRKIQDLSKDKDNTMARIAGIDLPKGKRGVVGLTYIHGIGSSRASYILSEAKVSEDKKVQDWTDSDISGIRDVIGQEV